MCNALYMMACMESWEEFCSSFFSDLANGYMMGTKDDMAIESWLFAFGISIGR